MWFNFRQNIIILDCEMSGLNPEKHQILEISALKCDPKNLKALSKFHAYVGPPQGDDIKSVLKRADPQAMLKNRLQNKEEVLSLSQSPSKVIQNFIDWLPDDYIIAGYNLFLDLLFLKSEIAYSSLRPIQYKTIDVATLVEVVRASKPGLIDDWSLSGACEAFKLPVSAAHSADGDCELVRLLLTKLLQVLEIKE